MAAGTACLLPQLLMPTSSSCPWQPKALLQPAGVIRVPVSNNPLRCVPLQEGIVPGGGAALLHLSEYVPEFKETLTDPEERLGADIIGKSLT